MSAALASTEELFQGASPGVSSGVSDLIAAPCAETPSWEFDSTMIANAFIELARSKPPHWYSRKTLTHLQVQKLVFFAYGWGLGLYGASLVRDRPQAWEYGPVFEAIYFQLKGFGGDPVEPLVQADPRTGKLMSFQPNQGNEYVWSLLDQVWQRYGDLSGKELSALAHKSDPLNPWVLARQAQRVQLRDDETKAYFLGLLP